MDFVGYTILPLAGKRQSKKRKLIFLGHRTRPFFFLNCISDYTVGYLKGPQILHKIVEYDICEIKYSMAVRLL